MKKPKSTGFWRKDQGQTYIFRNSATGMRT